MNSLAHLFENNRRWAEEISRSTPGFFPGLARLQTPSYLWIGCSDSRVPANEIVGLAPGELFVHRNIANLVIHSDMNCLSVIQYAVEVLKVGHIIVCGHYGCGGVKAAVDGHPHGLVDNWLGHVRDVDHRSRAELEAIADEGLRLDRLCELNVVEQVRSVAGTTMVQRAWRNGEKLQVHGWIYSICNGLLRDLGITLPG